MKHIPILFSTDMVQAKLANRKKMTRRTKGLEVINLNPGQWRLTSENKNICRFYSGTENNPNPIDKFWIFEHILTGDRLEVKCPYGVVRDIKEKSDILWVRESFTVEMMRYRYKADNYITDEERSENIKLKWRPSIHMPKAACRIFLRVTDVRCERLHDISEQDALDEGIDNWTWADMAKPQNFMDYTNPNDPPLCTAIDSFESLWAKINGQQSWDDNPWVWVVSFQRCDRPENFI